MEKLQKSPLTADALTVVNFKEENPYTAKKFQ